MRSILVELVSANARPDVSLITATFLFFLMMTMIVVDDDDDDPSHDTSANCILGFTRLNL